jgi:cell division protease FtsH
VLRIHTRTKSLSPTIDLGAVADATEHFTGAELEQVANEAALAMTRRGRNNPAADLRIGTDELLAAVTRVQKRGTDGDLLTVVLHDSAVRMARPRGRLLVRVTLDEGAPVEGSLEQASPQFFQLTRADGSVVTVARAGVRRVEQIAALG